MPVLKCFVGQKEKQKEDMLVLPILVLTSWMNKDQVNKKYAGEMNIEISALGYYPNPLDPDRKKGNITLRHIKKSLRQQQN